MSLLMNEFLDVLEDQASLYQTLLSVLQREHAAIVESKHDKLNEAVIEKETLILKIQNLENKRLNILDGLANSLGYPAQDLTLRKLSQLTENPSSGLLNTCRSNLLSLTDRVREANDRNKSLLTHAINLVKGSMVLLNNLMASNSIYYPSGKICGNDKNGRVFSGEI